MQKPVSDFKVLSIDGGGIRGISPATYLSYVEERLELPIHRYFDLTTGTSTGGLIALALARGISAKKIETLYREKGETIFTPRLRLPGKLLPRLTGSHYRGKPLHKELKRVFGKDTPLGEAKCRACIPALNITTGRVKVFKTRHHAEFERDYMLPMWRVAAATSAAPTFFPPVKFPSTGEYYIDGGLWANAPSVVGAAEGMMLGAARENIRVLSIGTGKTAYYKDGAPGAGPLGRFRFGVLGWGRDLVQLVMQAQSQRATNLADGYLLPEDNHVRVEFELPDGDFGLDAVHQTNVLAARAHDKAKNTAYDVRQVFFQTEAQSFEPIL